MPWKKADIKEYGEQVYRDSLSTKRSLEDCSWGSAMVAHAAGITKNEEKFRLKILEYARTTTFPKDFM